RLPTCAEWHWACRAGTIHDAPAKLAIGWLPANSGMKTHPVGKLAANAFGLHDMYGNVLEFCQDWCYEGKAPAPTGFVTDPKGPSGGLRKSVLGAAAVGEAMGGCFTP